VGESSSPWWQSSSANSIAASGYVQRSRPTCSRHQCVVLANSDLLGIHSTASLRQHFVRAFAVTQSSLERRKPQRTYFCPLHWLDGPKLTGVMTFQMSWSSIEVRETFVSQFQTSYLDSVCVALVVRAWLYGFVYRRPLSEVPPFHTTFFFRSAAHPAHWSLYDNVLYNSTYLLSNRSLVS